jgi:hypothetical protein
MNSQLSKVNNNKHPYVWTTKMEVILKIIRKEANVLSEYHNYKYTLYKSRLRYFRIPIIILSAINAFTAVGLQGYLAQELISIINAVVSLICGIITSIELFLNVQKKMENELISHKDYYHLNLDIFKTITLEQEKRNIDGKTFLDEKFSEFQKLLQNSNAIDPYLMPNLNRIEEEIQKIDFIEQQHHHHQNNYNDNNSSVSSNSNNNNNNNHSTSPITSPTTKRGSLQLILDTLTNKQTSIEHLSQTATNIKTPIQQIGKFVGDSCNQLVNPKYANLIKSREITDASYGELIQHYSAREPYNLEILKKQSGDSGTSNKTHIPTNYAIPETKNSNNDDTDDDDDVKFSDASENYKNV